MRRTEPDSIGFLERDAPLIFTSQYLVLEGRWGRGSADGIHRGGARRALGRADGPKRGWQITNSETRTFRVPGAGGSARVSTHWLVKSAPATSAVLTSAMVCVSESGIALKRVPAPSAVRFGAGSSSPYPELGENRPGFWLRAVQFRANRLVTFQKSRARRRRHGSRRPVCHGALSSPDAPPPPRVDHDARGIASNRRNIHGR